MFDEVASENRKTGPKSDDDDEVAGFLHSLLWSMRFQSLHSRRVRSPTDWRPGRVMFDEVASENSKTGPKSDDDDDVAGAEGIAVEAEAQRCRVRRNLLESLLTPRSRGAEPVPKRVRS